MLLFVAAATIRGMQAPLAGFSPSVSRRGRAWELVMRWEFLRQPLVRTDSLSIRSELLR